ncbi:hypothetical protein C8J57DRAFT_1524658 [Mycena rebaudengoi]|nr:hypothetical protein C8J57DRAFT_1524658 [Mycena rebaudengoi]
MEETPSPPQIEPKLVGSKAIAEELEYEWRNGLAIAKLDILVVGAPSSGKSTLLRQARLISGEVSDGERELCTSIIHGNLLAPVLELTEGTMPSTDAFISTTISTPDETTTRNLLLDDDFEANSFDSYFLRSRDHITSPGYIPSDSDILHCKLPTHPPLTDATLRIADTIFSPLMQFGPLMQDFNVAGGI